MESAPDNRHYKYAQKIRLIFLFKGIKSWALGPIQFDNNSILSK
jgi:hypothetical protein